MIINMKFNKRKFSFSIFSGRCHLFYFVSLTQSDVVESRRGVNDGRLWCKPVRSTTAHVSVVHGGPGRWSVVQAAGLVVQSCGRRKAWPAPASVP